MSVPELQEFRRQFPAYGDLNDTDLADSLAKKYPAYADLPGKVKGEVPASQSWLSNAASSISSLLPEKMGTALTETKKDIATIPGTMSSIGNTIRDSLKSGAESVKNFLSAEPTQLYQPEAEDVAEMGHRTLRNPTVAKGIEYGLKTAAPAAPFPALTDAAADYFAGKPQKPRDLGQILNPLPEILTVPVQKGIEAAKKVSPDAGKLLEDTLMASPIFPPGIATGIRQIPNVARYPHVFNFDRLRGEPFDFSKATDVTPQPPPRLPGPTRPATGSPIEDAQIVSPGLTRAAAERLAEKRRNTAEPPAATGEPKFVDTLKQDVAAAGVSDKPFVLDETPGPRATTGLPPRGNLPPEAPMPDWLRESINQEAANAQRLGIADRIEELSAERKTAEEVARQIATERSELKNTDFKAMVRAVRSVRSIPSMDSGAEFESWLTSRKATATVAPTATERIAAAQAKAEAGTTPKPFRTDQQAVKAAADEHIRTITDTPANLEYNGQTYTGAVKEGNNVRLKDDPDKVVRGVNEILKVEEKIPFDVPTERGIFAPGKVPFDEPAFAVVLKNGDIAASKTARSHANLINELNLVEDDLIEGGFVKGGEFIRDLTPEAKGIRDDAVTNAVETIIKPPPVIEQTAAGPQAVIPGGRPGPRIIPDAPIRPTRAQTEKPMELEQPSIQAKEPGLFEEGKPESLYPVLIANRLNTALLGNYELEFPDAIAPPQTTEQALDALRRMTVFIRSLDPEVFQDEGLFKVYQQAMDILETHPAPSLPKPVPSTDLTAEEIAAADEMRAELGGKKQAEQPSLLNKPPPGGWRPEDTIDKTNNPRVREIDRRLRQIRHEIDAPTATTGYVRTLETEQAKLYDERKAILEGTKPPLDTPAAQAQITPEATNGPISSDAPKLADGQRAGTGTGTLPERSDVGPGGSVVERPPASRPVHQEAGGAGDERTGSGGPGGGIDTGAEGRPGIQREPADAGSAGIEAEDSGQAGGTRGGIQPPAEGRRPSAEEVANSNYSLPRDQDWIPTTLKSRVGANVNAVQILNELERTGHAPSPEEQDALSKYVGWGGLKPVFDSGKEAYRRNPPSYEHQKEEWQNWEKNWGKQFDQVKAGLSPDEYRSARDSLDTQHYTSRVIINKIWEAVERLGFTGGNALEPAVGVGNFMGLTPDAVKDATRWRAIDIDSVAARIARVLYPKAKIDVTPYEKAKVPPNSQDLAISNVPFSDITVVDNRLPGFNLHNYYFARSVDAVKPGGVISFITSSYTMDAPSNIKARQYIAERADLLGAIRLPNTAFKGNANTEVTTDIIFLRKKDGTSFPSERWDGVVDSKTYKNEPIQINEYFANHPEMMLGKMSLEVTQYGKNQPALLPSPGKDLGDQMTAAIGKLPSNVFGKVQAAEASQPMEIGEVTGKPGTYVVAQNTVVRIGSAGQPVKPIWAGDPAKVQQAKGFISLRELRNRQVEMEINPEATSAEIETAREKLAKQYDGYVKKHGAINGLKSKFLRDDVDFVNASSLEKPLYSFRTVANGKQVRHTEWGKSDILTKRTGSPRVPPSRVDNIPDAAEVSFNFKGGADPGYIAELTGKPVETVVSHLEQNGIAFQDPSDGLWYSAPEYLSGFVRLKLDAARKAAAENPRYQTHVQELEKVQPARVPIQKASVTLGADWIPPETVGQWSTEILQQKNLRVTYTPITSTWHVQVPEHSVSTANATTWGVKNPEGIDLTGSAIIADALNGKPAIVWNTWRDADGTPHKARNDSLTLDARNKQDRLKKEFSNWAKNTQGVSQMLEDSYNDRQNFATLPQYRAPSWQRYPGANDTTILREDQKVAVTRGLKQSLGVFHAPGNGKTFIMTTIGMEARRLGIANKVMIVVHNSTAEQFPSEAQRLYPTAKIMSTGPQDFDPQHRTGTMARIATGDWDLVIIPQSQYDMIAVDPRRIDRYINDQLDELETARIETARIEGENSPQVRDIIRAQRRMRNELAELADIKSDDAYTFEKLGVNFLMVDEFHAYKKLAFFSNRPNIKGLDRTFSKRGFANKLKMMWIQEHANGRNTLGATGTPISNTSAEAWNMMRYLRPDVLDRYGITNFDQFASTFGDTKTDIELTAGGTWKEDTRFTGYTNALNLVKAWKETADVVTQDMVKLTDLPVIKGGGTATIDVAQTPELTKAIGWIRSQLEGYAKVTGALRRQLNWIPGTMYTMGKKASIDMRLIDPSLPDNPNSKLNQAVNEIERVYREYDAVKGTQWVFLDMQNDQSKNATFNTHDEIKRKLLSRGIPADQVVIMDQKVKGARRAAIRQRFNEGDIRVLIGHSDTLGTGLDAPKHTVAVIHVDTPDTPAKMEQRTARGVRQGNLNKEVEVISLGVKDSLDGARFQMMVRKQAQLNQLMRGDFQGNYVEDPTDDVFLDFQQQLAAYSGNPLAYQRFKLENDIKTLESIRSAHAEQVNRSQRELLELRDRVIPFNQRQLETATKVAKDFKGVFDQGYTPVLEIKGKTYTGEKDVKAAIETWAKKEIEAASIDALGKKASIRRQAAEFSLNGKLIVSDADVSIYGQLGEKGLQHEIGEARIVWRFKDGPAAYNGFTTGQGFLQNVPSQVERIMREPGTQEVELATRNRNLLELQNYVARPWEQQGELQQKHHELATVINNLTKTAADNFEVGESVRFSLPGDDNVDFGGIIKSMDASQAVIEPTESDFLIDHNLKPGDTVTVPIGDVSKPATGEQYPLAHHPEEQRQHIRAAIRGGKVDASTTPPPPIEFEEGGGTLGFPEIRKSPADLPQTHSPLERNFQPPAPGQAAEVVRRGDIIRNLQEAFQVPIRTGHANFAQMRAQGFFKVKEEVIRTKMANDFETVAHEIGHFISKKFLEYRYSKGNKANRSHAFDAELTKMGEDLYGDQKPKGGYAEEGIADFVRYYVINPVRAQREAPMFFAHFEERLNNEFTDVRDALHKARADWRLYQEQPAMAHILSQISIDEHVTKPWTLSGMYKTAVDDLHNIKIFEDRMLNGEAPLKQTDSPYLLARVFRDWMGRAEFFLTKGPIGFDTLRPVEGVKPLNEILASFETAGRLDELIGYLAARSAADRIALGQETGFDPARVRRVIEDYGKMPEFVQAAADIQRYQDALLDYAVKGNFYSPETIAVWKQRHPNHVSFRRYVDADKGGRGSMGKDRFANIASPIKRAKGGTEIIMNPLESLVKDTYAIISAVDQNNIGQKIVKLAQEREGMGKYVEEIPANKVPIVLRQQELTQLLEKLGVEGELELPPEMLVGFRPSQKVPGSENILTIRYPDKTKWFQVHPDLYESMAGLDEVGRGLLFRIFTMPTRSLRMGATGMNPEWAMRNIVNDQMQAAITSKYSDLWGLNLPGKGYAEGLFHIFANDDLYQAFQVSGARHSMMVGLDRKSLQKTLKQVIESGEMRGIWDTVIHHPIDSVRALINILSEEPTRVGEFAKVLRHEGGIESKDAILGAGYEARDMMDFARMGSGVKKTALNQLVAFFNSSIQGPDKTYRAFKQNPTRTMWRIMATVTVPSLLLWAMNKDDPRYDELPNWQKDLFWIIPSGDMDRQTWAKMTSQQKADFSDKHWIWRIPRGHQGILFGALPQRLMDWIAKNDPKAMDGWLKSFLKTLPDPTNWTNIMPLIENFGNWSRFLERKIVPRGKEDVEPAEQFGRGTSEAAKLMGGTVNYSPAKIEHLFQSWLGSFSKVGFDIADLFLPSKIKGEKPASTGADIPIVRAFVARFPGQPQSIERFYEVYSKANEVKATYDSMRRERRLAEAQQYAKDHRQEIIDARTLAPIAKRFSNLRKQSEVIMNSKREPTAKRRAMDAITFRMTDIANRVLQHRGKRAAASPSVPEQETEVDQAVNE